VRPTLPQVYGSIDDNAMVKLGNALASVPDHPYSRRRTHAKVAAGPGCCHRPGRRPTRPGRRANEAKSQVEFGIAVAQKGLWREAQYRWLRATEIDPTYAAAFNNLAIAYEQQGDAEKARAAYEKAVALEPNNLQIRQNYDLFKEINDRSNRRSDR